jgi:hypothetical protein
MQQETQNEHQQSKDKMTTQKTNKMSNSEFSVMTGNMFLFHIRHHRVKSSSSFVRERRKEQST